MDKGILLIALGHRKYTEMACMLAASIRGNDCELPITLCTDVDQVKDDFKEFFTNIQIVPPQYYTIKDNDTCYIKAKCHMNELTPYETTLFLDVDIVMINNGLINDFITQLSDVDFAIKNSGYTAYDSPTVTKESMQWANILEVKDAYKFTNEKIWNVHSEFIWWKKLKPPMNYLANGLTTMKTY